ncbi:MAG: hypothetical protein LBI15_02335 [Dysgonamonadaceae bacterium]|jgi:hypothetical protein|nr:hypothetical protein [Dysgonamonadaceae bacterium]
MKIVLLLIAVFSLISCGQVSQRQSANAVSENSDTLTFELCQVSKNETDITCLPELYLPPASEIDSLAMVLIAKAIDIPVGDSVVLNTFEDKCYRWDNAEESDSKKWLWSLFRQFSQQYDFSENSSTMFAGKYFRPLFNITPGVPHLNTDENFRAIAINIAEYQHFTLYSFLMENVVWFDELTSSIQFQSLASISNGRVLDNLIVAYTFSDGSGGFDSQFFYYDGKRIHIKKFNHFKVSSDGENDWFSFSYQQHQLTPHGRFIRYYEQNGIFENDNERGLVQNHTREGKWVDKDNFFHIEAEYKNGLPVGIWRYYGMLYDYDADKGFEILSSRRKGELLYTETYENSRLVRRELVNSSRREFDSEFFD